MPTIPTSDKFNAQPQPPSQPGQADGAAFDADHAIRIAQVNEGWVKNAQAGWLDGMNALLYHPDTGYLNQRGAPAVGGYGDLQDAMVKLYKQTFDNLGDDTQRGMFERSTAPLMGAFQGQVRQHAENQCRTFDSEASQTRFHSAVGMAVNTYGPGELADNMIYRNCVAIAHNELENSFRHTHGDFEAENNKPLWEHYLQFGPNGDGGMCAIHTGIVNRLLENNQPDGARRYLDGIESNLPATTRDKLDQFICTGENRQQALNAVLQAQAKSEGHAEQQKVLDGMRDNGKIDETVHSIASHSLQAAQQQQLTVQKQNDEQSLARVWGLKQNNPNAALTDIPASTLAYLKSRGLDKNAEAILSGHPATDDPALFNELHRLASADPVKFAQTSLITSSGQLSKAHMDYLQGLQDAINKQDPRAIAANTQVNDAVHTVQQEMKLTGIDLNPEAGSDREIQLAQAESGLRDRIIAAQQAKNGTPLTSDEVQNLAMGYFADQVLKGGVVGKGGDEKQPQSQGVQDEAAPDTQNSGHPQAQPDSKQTFPSLPNIMPHGAPVAAGTMADQRKTYPAALEVGKQMPNGSIAAGDDPDSRGYVVKSGKGGADVQTIADELGVDFDQLKELNHLSRKEGCWVKNGVKLVLPSLQSEGQVDKDHEPVVDIDAMTKEINRIAHAGPKEGCRRNVFDAVDFGLKKAGKNTRVDRDTSRHYAEESGPSLKKVGFRKIVSSADGLAGYTPKKGDIVVLQHYEGQGYYNKTKDKDGNDTKEWKDLPAGHIAIFDGKYWVSDFPQNKGSRIWGGHGFEDNRVGLEVYRP